uniref:Integrase catalytic domain-containing protein n=1 Tax=Tanacetum cinerariifolium TaxID=118510 RepID=A0A6L2N6P8_TANCI|nr:hypothetical protein [Tanacetum cinerariifolium]
MSSETMVRQYPLKDLIMLMHKIDPRVINSGCSRDKTGNRSYLTDYEEIDGGFVAFRDFKLTDESHVLLKVPRRDNMYSVDLKNIVPQGGLTCLFVKATLDESNLWHRRLGHINFKTINKMVKGNLVRGLPLKLSEINQTCVACQKGKQHRASCKTKTISSISQPLQMLHMDLFGLTFVKSLMKKMYCLAITDDFSRFSWVFFLTTKDETSEILQTFITGIENLIDLRVKVIRCDNGTEFKNRAMNQFCEIKGRKPSLSFMRPFGCPVTILNTIDHLGKFDGKADERFFVGYSTNNKAYRVFNSRTRIVKDNLHVKFSENTPNIAESRPNWIFDIDALTKSMNYKPDVAGNQSNGSACTKARDNVGKTIVEIVPDKDYILLSLWTQDPLFSSSLKDSLGTGFKPSGEEEKKDVEDLGNEDSKVPSTEEPRVNQKKDATVNDINNMNTVSPTDNAAGIEDNADNAVDENIVYGCVDDPNMSDLEEIGRFNDAENGDSGADMNNLDTYFQIKSIFLYGKIEEEVYVFQPPIFVDLDFSDKVYKVEKALYGLHQAPRARYETLSTYLLDNGFQRGKIDKTLFIKRDKRLQVKQKEDGIFISQDKYVNEILNKFGFSDVMTASTPMETHKTLLKDEKGEDVDEHLYRSMIGSLMYLTSSRPDIMFAVCTCARFQVNPKISHLHAVKRIFRYLKGQPRLGLWYHKDSAFDLVAYTDSDYARASLDRKSTIGGFQFLGCMLTSWQCKKQTVVANSTTEANITYYCQLKVNAVRHKLTTIGLVLMLLRFWTTAKAKIINGEAQIHDKVDGKKVIIPKGLINRDLRFGDEGGVDCFSTEFNFEQLTLMGTMASAIMCLATKQKFNFSKYILERMDNHTKIYVIPFHPKKVFGNMRRVGKDFSEHVADEAVNEKMDASLERAITIATSLDAEQDRGNISKTQFKATPNEPSSPRTSSGGSLRHQDTMGDTIAQTRFEKKRKSRTHGMKRLYKVGLRERVESFTNEESLGEEDASKQGRISDIDANQDIYLDLHGEEVVVEEVNAASIAKSVTAAATTAVSFDELTLAQVLMEIKTSKPKAKGIVIQEPSKATTTTSIIPPIKSQYKGKGIMIEPEMRLKKKAQIILDEELAFMIQAEDDEQERIVREKAQQIEEVNLAWDDIHTKVDADYELAQRLHA